MELVPCQPSGAHYFEVVFRFLETLCILCLNILSLENNKTLI
jgi:hypothetical protein